MVVQRLLILVRVLSHLPDWVSRWFARMLNAASPPFHVINFYGTNAAAVVYNRNRMGAKMDRVIDALQQSLIGHNAIALRNGMHFPTGWDPLLPRFHDVGRRIPLPRRVVGSPRSSAGGAAARFFDLDISVTRR